MIRYCQSCQLFEALPGKDVCHHCYFLSADKKKEKPGIAITIVFGIMMAIWKWGI